MSADLSAVLTKLDELTFEELLTLQEQLTRQLRVKAPMVPTRPALKIQKPPLELKVMSWDNWPPDATFRREEIYDDDGRY